MEYASKTIAKSFAKVALPQIQLLNIKGGCCGNGDQPPDPPRDNSQNSGG